MKLWIKTIICLMLVFIISLSPITTGILQIREAEASFVPFIVENYEWLLAILAAVGISFTSQSDAMAGIHDFAYNLDVSAYNSLQNYIEQQKFNNVTKLIVGELVVLGVWEKVKEYAGDIADYFTDAQEKVIEYIQNKTISKSFEELGFVDNDTSYYISKANMSLPLSITFVAPPYEEIVGAHMVTGLYQYGGNRITYVDPRLKTIYSKRGTSVVTHANPYIEGNVYTITYHMIDALNIGITINDLTAKDTWSNVTGLYVYKQFSTLVAEQEIIENISADLSKDDGISIDENIGALPLPAEGISSPWDNTVIVPPKSVSEGVRLSPQDVLQAPVIDSWDNPVYDNVGNPVYQPVPQTWPYTGDGYPPWTLTPDLPGIAEGVGDIGGILEQTRDYVRDLGRVITQDIPRILTTDLPLAIENIFKGTPPGDDENNDVTDKMKDFKLPDLIFLFFGVILACIRLMIRFITFLTSLLLRPADSSIIPAGMKESLNFLKNWSIGLPVSFYTLFSSLMAFLFGLRMIKYIKIFVANVHGGITQSYDPREFNDNQVYNEWSRSGYKTEYSDYRKVYDTWKDSNSNLPWKGYLKREARGRKW